jgi:hypothetical protein
VRDDWKTETFVGAEKFERHDWQPVICELAKPENIRTRLRQMQGTKADGQVY